MNWDKLFDWLLKNDISASDVILNSLMALVAIAILFSIIRMHTANGNSVYAKFNLVHLLVNKDGYPDGAKIIELGTWLLLSWGFIVQITTKALTEWYVQVYVVAFVIRGGYGAYLRSKSPEATPGTTTSTTVVSTEVTKQPSSPPAPPAVAPPAVAPPSPFAPPSSSP